MRRFAALIVLTLWLSFPRAATAHPTPASVAFVDFTVDGARIEQDVPVEELERSMKQALFRVGEPAEQMAVRLQTLLSTYARSHLVVTSRDSKKRWTTEVNGLVGHTADDGPRVRFHFFVRAPSGEATASVQIRDDVVAHEVVSHYIYVFLRSDWLAGTEVSSPEPVGIVHAGSFDVDFPRTGSFWHGFGSVIESGVQHIATGTDHVMFVVALLLAAPVTAQAGRWRKRRTARKTVLTLATLVSAFTIGHSATLVIGALGFITLTPAIVEPLIAVSIFVTALHALRPIFPRREAIVACGFGLIHGLAFASSLPQRDLGRAQTAWTLLGFNLGIELAQIALLIVVVPWLLLIARTRAFDPFRVAGASITALLALGWFLERVANVANPTAVPLAWVENHPMIPLLLLSGFSLLARASLPLAVVQDESDSASNYEQAAKRGSLWHRSPMQSQTLPAACRKHSE